MKSLSAIAAILLLSSAAAGSELPKLHQEGWCQTDLEYHRYKTIDDCMDTQQAEYDKLKAEWDTLPAEWSDQCLNRSRYSELRQCFENLRNVYAENSRKAISAVPSKPFRY